VTSVSLNKSTLSLAVGANETLTATVAPSNATNQNITWNSSAPSIASVDNTGKVTAVAAGTTTITATTAEGGFIATCSVTVSVVDVTGVSLNKNTLSLAVGANETLTATVLPTNATNQSVTWSSNAPSIADVDNTGVVTVVAAGTAVITATTTDGGFTATCTVNVLTGVFDVETRQSLHPNPFTGIVHLTGAEGSVLKVFNTTGTTVHTQKISAEDESINLAKLPAGMYFFRIEKDGKTKTVKAVKQ
jgi:transglutaminase/protease-like cytokinesis protein 3